MKAFFLRELAFVMAPALMLLQLKELASRAISVLIAVILAVVLSKTLLALALGPVGWAWLGVAIGVGVSLFLLLYLLQFSM